MTFEVFKEKWRNYRWRIRDQEENIVAISSQVFKTEKECERAMKIAESLIVPESRGVDLSLNSTAIAETPELLAPQETQAESEEDQLEFSTTGAAAVLSYSTPEPMSYSGRSIIEIPLDAKTYFKPEFQKPLPSELRASLDEINKLDKEGKLDAKILEDIESDFSGSKIFPNARISDPSSPLWQKLKQELKSNEKLAEIKRMLLLGKRLNIYKILSGELKYNYLLDPSAEMIKPRLLLVETYRLSSFWGNYGPGKTISTFSLMPGEETTISIQTYRQIAEKAQQASSVLDSFSTESASELETAIQSEQASREATESAFQYHVDANVSACWGWGSANVNAGVAGGVNSSRENFARNVQGAMHKHVAKASSNRDVQISMVKDITETQIQSSSTVRKLANINKNRTLNFVFRQMNQEYITILHLVDVRIGFFNGYGELQQEVALSQMEQLLDEVTIGGKISTIPPERGIHVLDPTDRVKEVKEKIIHVLENIYDHLDQRTPFIENRTFTDDGLESSYWRIKKDMVSEYEGISVPGIILGAEKHTIRTEGVVVEALLGQADALDELNMKTEEEGIRNLKLKNDYTELLVLREKLLQKIIETKDNNAAKLFAMLCSESVNEDMK